MAVPGSRGCSGCLRGMGGGISRGSCWPARHTAASECIGDEGGRINVYCRRISQGIQHVSSNSCSNSCIILCNKDSRMQVYVVACAAKRVGLGVTRCRSSSFHVSGVVQSSVSSPPVSPLLGLRHQKKPTLSCSSTRNAARAWSHTRSGLPAWPRPPHSPSTTAGPVERARQAHCRRHTAGRLEGKSGAENRGCACTLGPYTCVHTCQHCKHVVSDGVRGGSRRACVGW